MSKKNLYAFIIAFILLSTVIVFNRIEFNNIREYASSVDHTRDVITTFQNISNDFKSAQVYTPTFDTASLKPLYDNYKHNAGNIDSELQHLKVLVVDNPIQVARIDTLSAMINSQLPALLQKNTSELVKSGETWRLQHVFKIHETIKQGIAHENNLLATRKKNLDHSLLMNDILAITFAAIALVTIIATFLSIFFISKRRNWLEGFLESILNTSQNGILHYKAVREKGAVVDFKIEYANKAVKPLLGIEPDNVIGKKLSELSSFVRETDLLKKFVEVVETAVPAQFEAFYDRNNIHHWLLVSLVKLEDGLTATFHNITELKNSEEHLRKNIEELERSNTELEQYAYIASHDLQEPLRKIRSYGSYLEETQANKLDAKGQQHLGKIINSAERMSVLIKDVLAFSSLKKEEQFIVTDLNKTLHSVLQDLDLLISQKNAVVEAEHLPTIEAIPLQMNQLFYNLINNSLKFSKDNVHPTIKILCRQLTENEKPPNLPKNKAYFEIVFTDNGIGFNQEYSEQIFGLFKRLNDRQLYQGSGIGLALCKKVVHNHNGEIIAKGKEDEGASFYVYLPEKHF